MAVNFTVTFKKDVHTFSLDPTITVQELKDQLHELTGVPPSLQKLLTKGQMKDEMKLSEVPIVSGSKIMLIGTPQADVDKMKIPKLPPQQLASRPVAATRRMGGIATFDTIGADTRFGSIKVLEGWPNSDQARQILLKLSTDNSIVEVMKKHNWKVGVLSELTPLEYTKLGFNMNRGAEISLRLRFEDGFRQYDTIKKVLYHELAHMEVDDHNNEFKTLNSLIKRECEAVGPGRKLGEGNTYYNGPSSSDDDEELEHVDHGGVGYRLGGDETASPNAPLLTPSQAAAQAALRRFGSTPQTVLSPQPKPSVTSKTPSASTTASTSTPASTPSSASASVPSSTTSSSAASSLHPTSAPSTLSPSITNPQTSSTQITTPQNSKDSTTIEPKNTPTESNAILNERSCPVCAVQFEASATERQVSQHVNSCLDKL